MPEPTPAPPPPPPVWAVATAAGAALGMVAVSLVASSAPMKFYADLNVVLPVPVIFMLQPAQPAVFATLAILVNVAALRSYRKPKGALALMTAPPLAPLGSEGARFTARYAVAALGVATALVAWLLAYSVLIPLLRIQPAGSRLRLLPSLLLVALPLLLLVIRRLGLASGPLAAGIPAALVPLGFGVLALALARG